MLLKLEGHRDLPNATIDDVVRAVYEMARPDGPTYLIVENGQDSYAQAAGTDGRYAIESDKKRWVRFDLPRGLDAASIAKAIRENCQRILDEAAELRQAAVREAAGEAPADASPSRGSGQAEGRLSGRLGAET